MGAELTDSVIPLEAELAHAIDFEKGCYIGQEIVARMKYRGHPNRLLRGIVVDTDSTSPDCCILRPGAPIFNGRQRGRLGYECYLCPDPRKIDRPRLRSDGSY